MKSGTAKVKCSCHHEYQDQLYGPQVRVANATQKGDATKQDVRCTVCSKIHSVPHSQIK